MDLRENGCDFSRRERPRMALPPRENSFNYRAPDRRRLEPVEVREPRPLRLPEPPLPGYFVLELGGPVDFVVLRDPRGLERPRASCRSSGGLDVRRRRGIRRRSREIPSSSFRLLDGLQLLRLRLRSGTRKAGLHRRPREGPPLREVSLPPGRPQALEGHRPVRVGLRRLPVRDGPRPQKRRHTPEMGLGSRRPRPRQHQGLPLAHARQGHPRQMPPNDHLDHLRPPLRRQLSPVRLYGVPAQPPLGLPPAHRQGLRVPPVGLRQRRLHQRHRLRHRTDHLAPNAPLRPHPRRPYGALRQTLCGSLRKVQKKPPRHLQPNQAPQRQTPRKRRPLQIHLPRPHLRTRLHRHLVANERLGKETNKRTNKPLGRTPKQQQKNREVGPHRRRSPRLVSSTLFRFQKKIREETHTSRTSNSVLLPYFSACLPLSSDFVATAPFHLQHDL
mmetsp:Transcript_14598/g.47563  ORF Transcript_14598/g.47563 Transcript_14598/m.47563 type:complete len:444 (-) Transcript_14598:582-1913(-)